MAIKFGVTPGNPGFSISKLPSRRSYRVNWANPITKNLVFFASWLNIGTDLATDLVRGRRSTRGGVQTRKAVSDPEMGEVFEWGADTETGAGRDILSWGILSEWNGRNQASIAVWLKVLDDATGTEILFGIQDAGNSWEGYNVETWTSGMRNAEASPDDTYIGRETTGTGLPGKWELLVNVYDGTKSTVEERLKLYQNTVPLGGTVGTIPTALGTFTDIWQMHAGNFGEPDCHYRALYFAGWQRSLTPYEVSLLYAPQTRFDIYRFDDPTFFLILDGGAINESVSLSKSVGIVSSNQVNIQESVSLGRTNGVSIGISTISVVQTKGTRTISGNTYYDLAFDSNITAGNRIVIIVGKGAGTDQTPFVLGDISKSAGTATLGSFTMEKSATHNENIRHAAIYSAHVTGSGSCTIRIAVTIDKAVIIALAEIHSGLGSLVVGNSTNSGQGNTGYPSSGDITTDGEGIIIGGGQIQDPPSEIITEDTFFTNIYKSADVNYCTGASEYRIVPQTTTDAVSYLAPSTVKWVLVGATYLVSEEIEESISLEKNLGVSFSEQLYISDSYILTKSAGIVSSDQIIVEDSYILTKSSGIISSDQIIVEGSYILTKSSGIVSSDQIIVEDNLLLSKLNEILSTNQADIQDFINLLKLKGINIYSSILVDESSLLNIFENLVVVEQTGSAIEESITLSKRLYVTQKQPAVEESVILTKSIGIISSDQVNIQDTSVLIKSLNIISIDQVFIQDLVSFSISNLIISLDQIIISDEFSLNKLLGISSLDSPVTEESISLIKNLILSSSDQLDILDNINLGTVLSINAIETISVYDSLIFLRSSDILLSDQVNLQEIVSLLNIKGIEAVSQVFVNDALSFSLLKTILVIEETQGQYAEVITLARYNTISILQEGISNVSESSLLSRLNGINITDQNISSANINLARSDGLSSSLTSIISVSSSLDRFATITSVTNSNVNNDISLSYLKGLNSNDQLILNYLVNLSRSNELGIFDSRYVLENIEFGYTNYLNINDNALVFENIGLYKIDFVTLVTLLIAGNEISLYQFKYVIAEPSLPYIYILGDHSVAVLFRNKSIFVPFRDKSIHIPFRDKRLSSV